MPGPLFSTLDSTQILNKDGSFMTTLTCGRAALRAEFCRAVSTLRCGAIIERALQHARR
jgi:hypothetical protein